MGSTPISVTGAVTSVDTDSFLLMFDNYNYPTPNSYSISANDHPGVASSATATLTPGVNANNKATLAYAGLNPGILYTVAVTSWNPAEDSFGAPYEYRNYAICIRKFDHANIDC